MISLSFLVPKYSLYKKIFRIIGIIQLHCIVLADYAGGISLRWSFRTIAPNGAQYLSAWEQALADVFVKNHFEVY